MADIVDVIDENTDEEQENNGKVSVVGNRIYFYDTIDDISLLGLSKALRKVDNHNINTYFKNSES